MTEKQKMLMVTVFYNPAVTSLEAITHNDSSVTEESLFANLQEHLKQGSLVRFSHIEATLLRPAHDQPGRLPAHEWVGLTYVPVQPATACTEPAEVAEPVLSTSTSSAKYSVQAVEEAIFMEETIHAY